MLFMPNLNLGGETMRISAVPGASLLAVTLSG
jgi:hypothetical protein